MSRYDPQLETARNYELPPSFDYVVTAYSVERGPNCKLMVRREYHNPEWKSGMAYHQLFSIGPRGGVKVIYDELI